MDVNEKNVISWLSEYNVMWILYLMIVYYDEAVIGGVQCYPVWYWIRLDGFKKGMLTECLSVWSNIKLVLKLPENFLWVCLHHSDRNIVEHKCRALDLLYDGRRDGLIIATDMAVHR